MKFRTEIEPLDARGLLSHSDSVLLLGSCFTTSVGQKMTDDGFDTLINPFGALYNPLSIAESLRLMAGNGIFTEADIVRHDGLSHTFYSHTALSAPTDAECLERHNRALAEARSFLTRCTAAIVTLGTAWVFRLSDSGRTVANCHKLPADRFTRSRLTVEECAAAIDDIIATLRAVNSDIRILFTVSPIRHAADGAHGNMLSKSTLLMAIDSVVERTDGVTYFPSFEIMLDDLRDYRFYAADMRHPSDVAVDYIYSLFASSFFTPETQALAAEFRKITRRLAHRHLTDDTEARRAFAEQTATMLRALAALHPELKHRTEKIINSCHIV